MPSLTKTERQLFKKLSNPLKIQDFLDTLPINFERDGDTHLSPRRVIREHKAHCMEGALLAAAILQHHGQKPLLMDFTTQSYDEDHVVALFKANGYWGAISKTNHPILRWRDPIFKTARELALSYFHEYFMFEDGRKTLVSYSSPVSLQNLSRDWITAEEDLFWVDELLDGAPHHQLVPPGQERYIRKSEPFARKALGVTEWS
jgi:hypothetical protein